MKVYRLFRCVLARREVLSRGFVRITLAGPELADVSPVLGDQRVKLVLGNDDELDELARSEDWYEGWRAMAERQPPMRTYTLSGVRIGSSRAGEVDIDVVVHADSLGPASLFATTAGIGAPVGLVAADRTVAGHDRVGIGWHPGDARRVLLAADETALPAAANLLAELGDQVSGQALLEVPHADDVRRLVHPDGVVVRWFVRERGESLLSGLGAVGTTAAEADDEAVWAEGSGSDWYGWVAGESAWVRQIRALLKQAGHPADQMSVMGYWRRGVSL